MVQDQLVEYISSQMKAGVSRDAIKAALGGAGWTAADVEDTFRKIDGIAPASVAAKPAVSPAASVASPAMNTAGGMQSPQSIKVSDLISASPATAVQKPAVSASVAKPMEPTIKNMAMPAAVSSLTATKSASMPGAGMKPIDLSKPSFTAEAPKTGGGVVKIVGIVLIVAFAALAGFFYWQNMGLAKKVGEVGNMGADVLARVATLTAEVKDLNASNAALAAEVEALTGKNDALLTSLSFIAVPPGASTSTETVSVSGKLAAGKSFYMLTTPYGIVVYVQNAKDAKVNAALAPLAAATSTDMVELTGTHAPGSQYITVTEVNGTAL